MILCRLIAFLLLFVVTACSTVNIGKSTTDEISSNNSTSDKNSLKGVTVVDGDTIKINNREIRLFGIDAPEYMQTCKNEQGNDYLCGVLAQKRLQSLVTKDLNCVVVYVDHYKRDVSICYSNKINLNKEMVFEGFAVTREENPYLSDEEWAQKHKISLWEGSFVKPQEYRKQQRIEAYKIKNAKKSSETANKNK